jgi:hypothetical protein
MRVNDWLDVMLGEIERKKQEAEEALEESERRSPRPVNDATQAVNEDVPAAEGGASQSK